MGVFNYSMPRKERQGEFVKNFTSSAESVIFKGFSKMKNKKAACVTDSLLKVGNSTTSEKLKPMELRSQGLLAK